ncbi:hypothetical protein M413DRAFT_24379 [Hebeloma cylindrosporum]|uniref:Uncharacterized protein n=1 Tax=Hebeloma cylindrosporum TaxID=76867 RepID=A0A0C3C8J0_HEBCY|nr:hypothetical protein M413DRAFT_24379 [Hebeloma cylindrosporum h7]
MISLLARSRGQRTLSRSFSRLSSTSSHPPRRFGFGRSFLIGATAGVAGGGTLLVAGTHDIFIVLGDLRQAAKAYVAFLPGAGFLVDRSFDAISQTVDDHAEEANTILNKAYVDILKVVVKGGDENRMGSVVDILAITRNLLKDMKDLGIKAGQPISQKLEMEKHAATISTAAISALDEIKSRRPGVQESLSKISKQTTNWIGEHGPQSWRKVEAKPAATEGPEALPISHATC